MQRGCGFRPSAVSGFMQRGCGFKSEARFQVSGSRAAVSRAKLGFRFMQWGCGFRVLNFSLFLFPFSFEEFFELLTPPLRGI